MKLGTFWGLPATMILLAYDDVDEILEDITFTRNKTANDIITDLHTELYYLKQASKYMTCELLSPTGEWVSQTEEAAQIVRGTVVSSKANADVVLIDARNEIVIRLAQKIIDGEKRGISFSDSVTCRDDLERLADSTIANESFACSEIPRVAGRLYRSLKGEGKPLTQKLLQEFENRTRLLDSFLPGVMDVQVRECLSRIFNYYMERMDTVNTLFHETVAKTRTAAKVFDRELSEFLQRHANYLDHVTIGWFKYVEKNANEATLMSTVEDFNSNLRQLINLLETTVVSTESIDQEGAMYDPSAYSVLAILPHAESYKEDEIQVLERMYHRVQSLDLDLMASRFGVEPEILEKCLRKACSVGICGLNNQSEALYKECLTNVILADEFTCSKSQDFLDELQVSIANAKDIIENIKPIGAKLGE